MANTTLFYTNLREDTTLFYTNFKTNTTLFYTNIRANTTIKLKDLACAANRSSPFHKRDERKLRGASPPRRRKHT